MIIYRPNKNNKGIILTGAENKNFSPQANRIRLGLTSRQRVKKTRDFDHVYDYKLSSADDRLIVYAKPNELEYSRLGLSVGKKLGNALQRNRYKRTLR